LFYSIGQDVIKDYIYAHMWLNISATNGDEDAAKSRDIIAKRMTPANILTAQKLDRECVKKKYKWR
tara:strand:+ start:102 stop:299 length:198 start_codon:yes stop_codon:yes gene_type:complete